MSLPDGVRLLLLGLFLLGRPTQRPDWHLCKRNSFVSIDVHHVQLSNMSNMSMSISSPVPPSNPGSPNNQRNGSHRCNGSDRQGNLRGNYVESRIFKRQKNILGSDFSMWVISFLSIAIFEHWSQWRLTSYRASCVWHHVTLPRHSVRSVRENNGHLCLKHMNFGKIL